MVGPSVNLRCRKRALLQSRPEHPCLRISGHQPANAHALGRRLALPQILETLRSLVVIGDLALTSCSQTEWLSDAQLNNICFDVCGRNNGLNAET